MIKNNILEKIGQALSGLEVDLGYVFGSFLKSDEFEDVDIAVLTRKKPTPYEGFKLSMQIARKLEHEIMPRLEYDVKILNLCPLNFKYNVTSTGRLVFCRDECLRIRYEESVIGEFLDYAPVSQWLDERFLAEV
jgi:predicted nucleotidyltransferase